MNKYKFQEAQALFKRGSTCNHLGSTAFTTDGNATVTQGFLYAPFGEITTEYAPLWQNGTLPKYSFNAKELDEETGMYYYEARYYAPPVFTSRDPMFEKYFWMSPYAYCANNPVKYVDPTGKEISTHTDENGNVVAVFDDGDNGVYRHKGDQEQALKTVSEQYSSTNTSAGGLKMGESLHSLSFADQSVYNSTGKILPKKGMKIDFGSKALEKAIREVKAQKPSIHTYMKNAKSGGVWDLKMHYQCGSLLFGKYASPRDAGNFLAGMFANAKGSFMEEIIQFGYGAYNLSGNSLSNAVLITLGYVGVNAGTTEGVPFEQALQIRNRIYNGEDVLSQRCIDLGKRYNNGKRW